MLLAQLMQPDTDLSSWSDEQVVKAARARKTATKTVERRTATELHRRGWTWEQIGKVLGVNQSTVHRWVKGRVDRQQ